MKLKLYLKQNLWQETGTSIVNRETNKKKKLETNLWQETGRPLLSQVSQEEQALEAQILRSPIHSDLIIKCIYSELICSAFTVRIAKRGTSPRSKILRSPIYSDPCHQYTRTLTFQNLWAMAGPHTFSKGLLNSNSIRTHVSSSSYDMYPPPHIVTPYAHILKSLL